MNKLGRLPHHIHVRIWQMDIFTDVPTPCSCPWHPLEQTHNMFGHLIQPNPGKMLCLHIIYIPVQNFVP